MAAEREKHLERLAKLEALAKEAVKLNYRHLSLYQEDADALEWVRADLARLAAENERLTLERDELVDGIKHALTVLFNEFPEDDVIAKALRHHLMGTITDRNGHAMITQEDALAALAEQGKGG